MVVCSPFIAYNGVPESILYGELVVLAIYGFFKTEKNILRALLLAIIGVLIGFYISGDFRCEKGLEAFRNTLAYTYIALIVWIFLKNKKDFKFDKKDIIWYVLGTIIGLVLCLKAIYDRSVGIVGVGGERF